MSTPDTCISSFIPLSSQVAPQVLKTTAGDYLICWRLEGLPFVGREEWELEHRHATFNRLLQSLRAPDYVNVAFWTHDVRRRGTVHSDACFDERFNQQLSDAYFKVLSEQKVLQNQLYFTLIYRPVVEGRHLVERSSDLSQLRAEQDQAIAKVLELAGHVEAVLHDYVPTRLGMYESEEGTVFSEALEFYSYLLNRSDDPVPVLSAPVYEYLPLSRHLFSARGGDFVVRTPEGSNHYGAVLNVKEYPDATWPGVLNGLKYLDFEYVITQSFTPHSRHAGLRALERTKGMMISSGDRGVSQIIELDQAMDELASGNFVLGEYHFTLALYGTSQEVLQRQIAEARAELAHAGFVSVKEDLAITGAFYAQLPGNWRYRPRLANVSSLNFLGLSPLHNFASGKRSNNPWGDSVTVLQATNGQPYHFNFHATHPGENSLGEKAIGNTLVIGKSGTGKTALINFLLSQAQKFRPKPTIFFFDKDRGAEIFVRACGGNYLALESGQLTGFNPLQCESSEANVQYLVELLRLLAGKLHYTAGEEEDMLHAVRAMLDTPLHLRTISNLQKSLPNMGDDSIYARLRKWTRAGALGWVFDNPQDTIDLSLASIIGFDYTDIIDNAEVRTPVIHYLLHRLEGLIDGRPLMYVMDEFWKILDGEGGLKEFARNKQKTIRKQNGLGIFATQSPEDALRSDIAAALIEQTATLILLPNPNADRKDYIDGLKLTESEFKVITSLDERSRCFLVKQGHASAVCQLDLRDMHDELAVISASTDNIAVLHEVLQELGARNSMGATPGPEDWLPLFQARRKGARKRAAAADEAAATRQAA